MAGESFRPTTYVGTTGKGKHTQQSVTSPVVDDRRHSYPRCVHRTRQRDKSDNTMDINWSYRATTRSLKYILVRPQDPHTAEETRKRNVKEGRARTIRGRSRSYTWSKRGEPSAKNNCKKCAVFISAPYSHPLRIHLIPAYRKTALHI